MFPSPRLAPPVTFHPFWGECSSLYDPADQSVWSIGFLYSLLYLQHDIYNNLQLKACCSISLAVMLPGSHYVCVPAYTSPLVMFQPDHDYKMLAGNVSANHWYSHMCTCHRLRTILTDCVISPSHYMGNYMDLEVETMVVAVDVFGHGVAKSNIFDGKSGCSQWDRRTISSLVCGDKTGCC